MLAQHTVEDVSVEDPPLEEVIAEMFSLVDEQSRAASRSADGTSSSSQDRERRSCRSPQRDVARIARRVAAAQPGGRSCASARRAAGLSRRLRARHADAVPADRHADVSVGRRSFSRQRHRQSTIAGYTYDEMIAYYLLTHDQPGVFQHAGLAIEHRLTDSRRRDQEIPDPAGRPDRLSAAEPRSPTSWCTTSWRPGRSRWCSFCAAATFPAGPTPTMLLAFVASLVMAFLLGFFLEATLGMIGFWFLEVSSLLFVYMLFNFFFSGHMFPIDMLPGYLGHVGRCACRCSIWPIFRPPCSWARSRATSWRWGWRFELAWVVFFIVACRVTFHRGVKRYSGYGG